jgi:hypothetical protein
LKLRHQEIAAPPPAGCSSTGSRLQLRRQVIVATPMVAAPPPLVAARPVVDCSSSVGLLQLCRWLQHRRRSAALVVDCSSAAAGCSSAGSRSFAVTWFQLRRGWLQLHRQAIAAPPADECSTGVRWLQLHRKICSVSVLCIQRQRLRRWGQPDWVRTAERCETAAIRRRTDDSESQRGYGCRSVVAR